VIWHRRVRSRLSSKRPSPKLAGLTQLSQYNRGWLRGDLVAGITVAAYLVPQVMAYAGVAGVPPVAGLWAAIVAILAYAVLGTSRRLSVGPESTTALLTAVAIGPLAGGIRSATRCLHQHWL
jgi:SulP family sulfate permease